MGNALRTFVACAALVMVVQGTGMAQEKADLIVYDFEHGMPKDCKLTSSAAAPYAPTAELEENFGNTVLELGKNALLTLGGGDVVNFSIEATIRREYDASGSHAGFQFRNGYRVYFRKPGRLELTGPRGAKGRGFARNRVTHKPVRLKIVVVGPVVRFFVNGKYEGQFDHLEKTPGPVALYQRGIEHNCYFDNVKLNTRVDPAQFLACEPVTGPDRALVFDPAKDVNLRFRVTNHADLPQEAELGVDLATFDGKPVRNTTSPTTLVLPGQSKTMNVSLGRVPEGYYRVTFLPTGKVVPLAVHQRGTVTHDKITTPKILTGVYWYYFGWQGLPDVWWNTYVHAACNDLRRHNINTIICAIGMPTESIEIASQYGIRCFVRGTGYRGNVSHPNVIGGFLGDEPHKGQEKRYIEQYTKAIEKYPDKVFTTCMIGDGGVEGCQPWWDAWMPLSKKNKVVRMFRWYGIKRFTIGIKRRYASLPPLEEILRDMSRSDTPYYFIMPSFGSNEGVQSYYANPLPSQIKCMMHLAAAFGADGLFFWTYQTPFPGSVGFVDPATLLPEDGKWAAAGETAGKILKNADLLSECTWAGRYPFVDGPSLLEVFQLRRKDDPAQYFYAVNKDTEKPINARLFHLETDHLLRDLFNGGEVPITQGTVQLMRPDQKTVSGTAPVSLLPGDGLLLKYGKPAGAEGQVAARALPRVRYPKRVADAPEGKIIWLADLKPIEMPAPGWIPRAKFRGKKWFPDYNAHDLLLYSGPQDAGQLYKKSLWAHAETTIKYKIPEGAVLFAAAAGFGNKDKRSSAVFRVLVDGKEKYNSGVMKLGMPVQPVVVDIAGGKILELITEEAGDGLYADYTFWGEARLIKR